MAQIESQGIISYRAFRFSHLACLGDTPLKLPAILQSAMSERIYKLQPNRTMSLRGFDALGASAAIHSATANSFAVSGNFRDAADFAVLVLWDADNFYEHPRLKYLPDFNFSGLTLTFDMQYDAGLQPIDSPKSNWIDWATLDYVLAPGPDLRVTATVPLLPKIFLWDHCTLASGNFTAAVGTFHLQSDSQIQPYDRVTLWFQNFSYDFVAPVPSVEYQFFDMGAGAINSITVNARVYSHTESNPGGESGADQANALVALINAGAGDAQVTASVGSVSNAVLLTAKTGQGGAVVPVSGTGNAAASIGFAQISDVAIALAAEINSTNWWYTNPTHSLRAIAGPASVTVTAGRYGTVNVSGTGVTWVSGTKFVGLSAGLTITINTTVYTIASVPSPTRLTLTAAATNAANAQYVADRGGVDGNLITMYSLSKTTHLSCLEQSVALSGGNSAVTWQCSLDFTALGLSQLRQCWLTFAPPLANGKAFAGNEWSAAYSNWTLTGPETTKALQVAGPNSVRVEDDDTACVYTGTWATLAPETGFYSGGIARATSALNDSVTVTYSCGQVHNLYLGTSLYTGRGTVGIRLDGDTQTTLDCYLYNEPSVNTRRLVRNAVPAGTHKVNLSLVAPGVFYFDFIEAAIPSDVPTAPISRVAISPALDYSTDHSYKLPANRVMWIMDMLGLTGPVNQYLGVFWYNQRANSQAVFPSLIVTFAGTWVEGDTATLNFGSPVAKTATANDTPSTIAAHFAYFINEVFVGVWASASSGILTITTRSPTYTFPFSSSFKSAAGTMVVPPSSSLSGGLPGTWVVDPSQLPALNRGARDWHSDLYMECASRGREVVTSGSMELVNPPAGFAAIFPDGTPVITSVDFAGLFSTHCAQSSGMLAYQKTVFDCVTDLQSAAGLIPNVQFGEYVWWYFTDYPLVSNGGMAFWDPETAAAAQTALGRPLHRFIDPNDDPTINGGADAIFLRNRLRDHVASLVAHVKVRYPAAQCEVLFPYDVNYPTPQGGVGGRLNNFINFPVEWGAKTSAGYDRLKIEALAFAGSQRNLDLALVAVQFAFTQNWPVASLRYLAPVFIQSSTWQKEVQMALGMNYPVVNLWAFDQVNIFGLDVIAAANQARSGGFAIT